MGDLFTLLVLAFFAWIAASLFYKAGQASAAKNDPTWIHAVAGLIVGGLFWLVMFALVFRWAFFLEDLN